MRWSYTFMFVMFHIPQMTELMVGARYGPARARGLHREAGDHQRGREAAKCFDITALNTFRASDPMSQASLNHIPIRGVDRVDSQTIGQDPIGASRAFGDEVGVARGVESFRCGRDYFQVGGYANRRRAVKRLLRAIERDRGAEGG